MPNQNAYIIGLGAFLPGAPVTNERIEDHLGKVGGKPSRFKDDVLASNGIMSRHYSIDDQGRFTHINEEMMANAVTAALSSAGRPVGDVGMLAVGGLPDMLMPGFASMV